MSRLPANALELNRTFLEIPDTAAGLDAEATLRSAFLLNHVESWEVLLKHPYVVVLGEAGTGKSTEFLLRAQALTAQGRFSFFMEFSELAEVRELHENGLKEMLDVDDERRFERWRVSQDDAVFFLDSLDEAKLQNHTLRKALRMLHRNLQDQWDRVRLVVSCRVSDWRAEADRNELRDIAPVGLSEVHIVQLAPLNTEQVRKLARAAGVTDVADFMRAVTDNHADVFIERPLDVQWLGSYWANHSRIESLQKLISDNLREKVKERSDRSSTLSLAKAKAGLRTLAGVAMITNRWTFSLPDDAQLNVDRATGTIDPQDFLPDWSAAHIAELLRRPVFDEATYGRVRLHHRSIQEFLAAQWLDELVSGGMAHTRIQELFLPEENGERAIPAHLKPVAAWLALWNERMRCLLIQEVPSLLIGHGDPSGFTDEERRQILRSYAKSYEGRYRRFENFDGASLQRFSSPVLSAQIEMLLKTPDTPSELVSVLLRIVHYGHISGCVGTCLALALDITRPSEVRHSAILATASIGTDGHKLELLELLRSTSEWEQDIAGAFVQALYPEPLDVQRLMQLLAAVKPERRNLITSLQIVLEQIPRKGSMELRLELLAQLLRVVWVLDAEAAVHSVPPQQQWLLPLVAGLVSSVLDELPDNAECPKDIALALTVFRCCNEYRLHIRYDLLDEMKRAVARHPGVRRDMFWRRVEEHRQREGSTPTRYLDLRYSHEIFELSSVDRAWLVVDARTRSEVRDRLLAFDALSNTRNPEGDQANHLEYLSTVADGIPELRRRLDRMLNRPFPLSPPSFRRGNLVQRARELREARDRATLEKRIDQIRIGMDFNALSFLYSRAKRNNMSYGDIAVASIEKRYGVEIADAAVAGWRAFWRTYEPPMPHECKMRNSTPGCVAIGLMGLKLDFENGLEAAALDSDETRRAVRYASWELNAFPAWLAAIANAHRDIVVAVLRPYVIADMMQADDGSHVDAVIAKLSRADDVVRAILSPCVADQLRAEEPPMVRVLAHALDIVIAERAVTVKDFAELARERCGRAIAAEKRFATWWEGWLSMDSTGALDFLEISVAEVAPEKAYQLVLQVCHRIHQCSETHATRQLPARHQPEVLKRLIPLVYEHIEPDDDIDHEDVFSPGPRDHAQEMRGLLISWLAEIPGTEAVQSLRELAEDPRLASIRDWLFHLADQRLMANATVSKPAIVDILTNLCKMHGTDARSNLGELAEGDKMVKILFLGANPLNCERLALDEEIREIKHKLRAARLRDSFNLSSLWAPRSSDLQQALLEESPTIVHFSGHGVRAAGLVFHSDDDSNEALVTAEALRTLFHILKGNVRVVVLNACYSEEQANAIVKEIDFVVGMSDEIDDDAARVFAAAFYRGLAFGECVQTAFNLGRNDIQLNESVNDKNVNIPVLRVRPGVDASAVSLA